MVASWVANRSRGSEARIRGAVARGRTKNSNCSPAKRFWTSNKCEGVKREYDHEDQENSRPRRFFRVE